MRNRRAYEQADSLPHLSIEAIVTGSKPQTKVRIELFAKLFQSELNIVSNPMSSWG